MESLKRFSDAERGFALPYFLLKLERDFVTEFDSFH